MEKKILKVGNIVGGGKAQGGSVYLGGGISPSLLSGMSHGNVMPYIVEVKKIESQTTRKHNADKDETECQSGPSL